MKSKENKQILWCLKQKKGVRLEKPNDNLSNAYILKAKSALNMLISAVEKNEVEWIATTAYYARYFSFYALLQKIGIKSEIHDCTISLMKYLFIDEKIVNRDFYIEFVQAKKLRVEFQYYLTQELNINKLKKDSQTARNFLLEMEKIIEELSENQIKKIREKIKRSIEF